MSLEYKNLENQLKDIHIVALLCKL